MRLDDDRLTEDGLAPSTKGRVLLLACGALAREILDVIAANGWDHLALACLPAKLHLYPEKIPGAVREKVLEARSKGFSEIYVVYADCGTGGMLDRVCEELGVERIAGPHCYSFFDGNAAFEARGDEEMRCFYLTDFLVKQFDAFVWKPLALDRHPELREMYFGHYERLVYLAQVDDPAIEAKARDCARRLGLEFEMRRTGYGDLAAFMRTAAGQIPTA